jgi:signal transduction histidine kinase
MFDFDSPEQMMAGRVLTRWRDLKDRDRMMAQLRQRGSVTNFETEAVTHSGRHIHVLFSAIQIGENIFGMVMDVTTRVQAQRESHLYQKRLRALATQLVRTEEKERYRIAADLHDHVVQAIALSIMQISAVRKRLHDPDKIIALNEICDAHREIIQQIRYVIYDLSPPQLDRIGLTGALQEWLEEHVEKRHALKVECIAENVDSRLNKDLHSILFRNTRELVTNVIKHSQATRLTVTLRTQGKMVKIFVRDNGVGFDTGGLPRALKEKEGFGIFSIMERMNDISGSLEIISEPYQGTLAILSVPTSGEDFYQRKR